jgi:hypothetical protein
VTETRLSASRHNGWVASDGMRNGTPDGTPFSSTAFGSSTMLGSVNDGDGGRHHHHGAGRHRHSGAEHRRLRRAAHLPGFRASPPIPGTLSQFRMGAGLLSGTNWDVKLWSTARM